MSFKGSSANYLSFVLRYLFLNTPLKAIYYYYWRYLYCALYQVILACKITHIFLDIGTIVNQVQVCIFLYPNYSSEKIILCSQWRNSRYKVSICLHHWSMLHEQYLLRWAYVLGANLCIARNASTMTLLCIHWVSGSQCNFWSTCVMCLQRDVQVALHTLHFVICPFSNQ